MSLQNLFMVTNEKHENIFVLEMGKRGLKPIQFENRYSVFGWVSSVDPEDWGEQNDDTSRDLAKKLCRRIEDEGMIVEARKNEDSVSE